MTDHDDARIDEALEALARPQPPADHVVRVLARTSAAGSGSSVGADDGSRLAYLRPRWILPVAATVLAVLGATWQIERQARNAFDAMTSGASTHAPGQPAWGAPEEVVQPVLPPLAYWGMDPFQEFATLRPGTHVTAQGPSSPEAPARQAAASARRESFMRHAIRARQAVADDELAPEPGAGLPAIELASIVPPSLDVAPARHVDAIALSEIALAPIVITPFVEEEKP